MAPRTAPPEPAARGLPRLTHRRFPGPRPAGTQVSKAARRRLTILGKGKTTMLGERRSEGQQGQDFQAATRYEPHSTGGHGLD